MSTSKIIAENESKKMEKQLSGVNDEKSYSVPQI